MRDPGQIGAIEQGWLQGAVRRQLLNRRGAQRCDPAQPLFCEVFAKPRAGDHAAIADEDHLLQAEAVAQFLHLRGNCFGIGGVSLENLHRHGAAFGVGE